MRTTAILRGHAPEAAVERAERCWAAGLDLVEVPVQGPEGWAAFEAVARVAGGRAFGAGTVLTADDARRAVATGASVVISPGLDADVVMATLDAGAVPLPGVLTPSDVQAAIRLGVLTCKLFPASSFGPPYLKALAGPFPDVGLVAVGGVGVETARAYLDAGARGVAFGGSIDAVLALPDPAAVVAGLHAAAGAQTR
jgi:2-dehydro-3-deoxyphosphogluconate aldolase/(4S)-4-hydroxy-2-oxoglutarate aldolase